MSQRYEDPAQTTKFNFGLHHVQLAIPPHGEEACREFYVGVLGLTEVEKPPALAARGGLWVRAVRPRVGRVSTRRYRPSDKRKPNIGAD